MRAHATVLQLAEGGGSGSPSDGKSWGWAAMAVKEAEKLAPHHKP